MALSNCATMPASLATSVPDRLPDTVRTAISSSSMPSMSNTSTSPPTAPRRCSGSTCSVTRSRGPRSSRRSSAETARERAPPADRGRSSSEIRRRPTLPGGLPPSTIGADRLNFRVRDGNGCDPVAMATEISCQRGGRSRPRGLQSKHERINPSPRPISTGRLNTLLCVHLRPINVMVSSRALLRYRMGMLILERVSHLDAFSGYPFRRWLICRALGRTTDTPELRPSRSSRTRDSLPQHSFGCGG